MNIEIVKGVLGGDPVCDKAEDELLETERDEELAAVVNMLRSDSSSAYLCGAESLARIYDAIVSRLEHLEHRR